MAIQVGDKDTRVQHENHGRAGPTRYHHRGYFRRQKGSAVRRTRRIHPGLQHDPPARLRGQCRQDQGRGVDTIVCMAVNDAFVMDAWGKAQNAEELLMLADGNGDFTAALGLELDGSGFGLGTRSQRFAMIVDDGTVTHLNVEAGPGVDVSSAETIMALL